MGMVLSPVRSRLADAEPQPEDRSAERKLGMEAQLRAWHPEEVVLEQSSSCRSLGRDGNFSDLKRQFHGALAPVVNGA